MLRAEALLRDQAFQYIESRVVIVHPILTVFRNTNLKIVQAQLLGSRQSNLLQTTAVWLLSIPFSVDINDHIWLKNNKIKRRSTAAQVVCELT